MFVEVLDTSVSELGEGIYLDSETKQLFWLDILKSNVYQYDLNRKKSTNLFTLDFNPSVIFSLRKNVLTYADRVGIKKLNLNEGLVQSVSIHVDHNSDSFRANDGVRLKDGRLIWGTMGFDPSQHPGKIYCQNLTGEIISHCLSIHIPNTFIELEDRLIISDSFKKISYVLSIDQLFKPSEYDVELGVWNDFSELGCTPDGGCLSEKGNLHIAMWGGAEVSVFNRSGVKLHSIELPVLNPTNCVFHLNRWLYVTSAREGMSFSELEKYPLSGKTLVVDLGENYEY